MLFYILLPDALLIAIAVIYLIDNLCQECACTSSRIENLYTMEAFHGVLHAIFGSSIITLLNGNILFYRGVVGQSFWQVKLLLQNLVNRPHNESNDRLWSVPDTFRLTQFGIVFRQEVLVEVNHGVMVAFVLTISFHDLLQIRSQEHRHQVIYYPCNTLIKVVTCKIIEYLTQERVSLRNQLYSLLTAKVLWSIIVQTCSKHTVGNSLGIDVCKIRWFQFLNEHVLKSVILPSQIVVGITLCIVVHGLLDDIF